jgi:hypothetical protein
VICCGDEAKSLGENINRMLNDEASSLEIHQAPGVSGSNKGVRVGRLHQDIADLALTYLASQFGLND